MTAWLVLLAIGMGTYALRASMFVALGDRTFPSWTATPLSLVGPAAIAALVASMTLTSNGSAAVASAPELLALTTAYVATRRSGNVMHAITVGLPTFWVASLLFG